MYTKDIYIRQEDFVIELDFELPNISISCGADWHKECNLQSLTEYFNDMRYKFYNVLPEYYESYTQYAAAYQLCRYAAGVDKKETKVETENAMSLCKAVVFTKKEEALRYYDCFNDKFLYILALNTCSPWSGQFGEFSDLSDVFYELDNRSCVQMMNVFKWLYDFFSDLSYKVCPTNSHELSDSIMWLSPEISIVLNPWLSNYLTNSTFGVSDIHLSNLSRYSAGVYRMNKKEVAKQVYEWCFNTGIKSKLSANCQRNIVSEFMQRLERGYKENVLDIDKDLISLLESHIASFKNKQWVLSHSNRLERYKTVE